MAAAESEIRRPDAVLAARSALALTIRHHSGDPEAITAAREALAIAKADRLERDAAILRSGVINRSELPDRLLRPRVDPEGHARGTSGRPARGGGRLQTGASATAVGRTNPRPLVRTSGPAHPRSRGPWLSSRRSLPVRPGLT